MKRKLSVLIILLVLLGFGLLTSADAKKKPDQVTTSAMVLAKFSLDGLIQSSPDDISTFVIVEPSWWNTLTNSQKGSLVNTVITVARNESNVPSLVIVQDMTSRDTVARGFVKKGIVQVYK